MGPFLAVAYCCQQWGQDGQRLPLRVLHGLAGVAWSGRAEQQPSYMRWSPQPSPDCLLFERGVTLLICGGVPWGLFSLTRRWAFSGTGRGRLSRKITRCGRMSFRQRGIISGVLNFGAFVGLYVWPGALGGIVYSCLRIRRLQGISWCICEHRRGWASKCVSLDPSLSSCGSKVWCWVFTGSRPTSSRRIPRVGWMPRRCHRSCWHFGGPSPGGVGYIVICWCRIFWVAPSCSGDQGKGYRR